MSRKPGKHLAQLNIGRTVDDLDSEQLAPFVAALDLVNGLAERAPGFVWRFQDDSSDGAIDFKPTDDPRLIINFGVWETPDALADFVWNTIHKQFYNRRANWFEPPRQPMFVMWWIDIGHQPTVEEAFERLNYLRAHGPSDHAFGWESLPQAEFLKSQRCA